MVNHTKACQGFPHFAILQKALSKYLVMDGS
jgi:hypothetical protein